MINKFMKLPQVMLDADTGTEIGGNGESKVDDVVVTDGAEAGDTNPVALTAEDVQKMIQSETDKVRGEYSKKLKEKESELEQVRLSTMTEAEKELEAKKTLEKSLSEREAQLLHKELTLNTIDLLKENNLPIEFKDFLLGKDADSTKTNVDAFQKVFNQALEAQVTERFKSTGKEHVESSGHQGRYTEADLKTMTAEQINANWDKIQRDITK